MHKKLLLLLLFWPALPGGLLKAQENKLMGHWKYVQHNKAMHSYHASLDGLSFYPNGSCACMPGFFRKVFPEKAAPQQFFLGTESSYKTVDDSLWIYNLSDSSWLNFKFKIIDPERLVLYAADRALYSYQRTISSNQSDESYDFIVISSSGCFGTCPVNFTALCSDGSVWYYGVKHNTVNGVYAAKITPQQYQQLQANFTQANIESLQADYKANWKDDEKVCVSFIRNNKIHKTICDYGKQAPSAFNWAYERARYLYQSLALDTIRSVINFTPGGHLIFEANGKVCDLTASEGFYLWVLLMKSEITQQQCLCEYSLKNMGYGSDPILETDGQLVAYKLEQGRKVIRDLGYNFIKVNGLLERARPKLQGE